MNPVNSNSIQSAKVDFNLDLYEREKKENETNLCYIVNFCLFGMQVDLYKTINHVTIKQINSEYRDVVFELFFKYVKSIRIFNYIELISNELDNEYHLGTLKPESIKKIYNEISAKCEVLAKKAGDKLKQGLSFLVSSSTEDSRCNTYFSNFNVSVRDFVDYENYIKSPVKNLNLKNANFKKRETEGNLIKFLNPNSEMDQVYVNMLKSDGIKDLAALEPILLDAVRSVQMLSFVMYFDKNLAEAYSGKELNPAAIERIYDEIFNFCDKSSKIALKVFKEGKKTIMETLHPERLPPVPKVYLSDFVGYERWIAIDTMKSPNRKQYLSQKQNESKINSALKSSLVCNINSCDEQMMFLKVFAEYTKNNPDLNLFNGEEFKKASPQIRQKILLDESKAKEAAAKKAEEELLAMGTSEETPISNAPKRGIKKGNPVKKSVSSPAVDASKNLPTKQKLKPVKVVDTVDSTQHYLFEMNRKLNTPGKREYSLSGRLLRWDTSDLKKISGFQDKDATGKPVFHYANLTKAELLKQQANHNFVGIERILSEKELDKYSFKYIPRGSVDGRIGRCFYADMDYNGKITPGIVNVGIGKDNVVFHAMFSPLDQTNQFIRHFFDLADKMPRVDENEETGWNAVSSCTFELSENDLVMKVARQNVKFTFRPLQST